jgi:histidyl-tRNA synthetase
MTPTVARMVATKRRELVFPLRWYSIPNLFRYEQPQRGRVREHWQLNVDIFGVDSINAEIEVINIAYDIMRAYGLKDTDFEIRINNRKLMNFIVQEFFGIDEVSGKKIAKLIDKKDKMESALFSAAVRDVFIASRGLVKDPMGGKKSELPNPDVAADEFLTLLNSKNFEEFASRLPQTVEEHVGLKEVRGVIAGLEKLDITNVRFDQTLMRGFDYYTGIVFEVFDLNPANRRSVFGGGRYDDLLALFGNEKVSGVGFGAGDVIARDIMETYGTLPKSGAVAEIAICVVGEQNIPYSMDVAQNLREKGTHVAVDISGKKLGDQISNADKRGIPKVICIGDEEVKTGKLKVKDLKTGEESEF